MYFGEFIQNVLVHVSSRGMPIQAHNELFPLKKQVIMLYEIYLIKQYHFSIINSIVILRLKLFKPALR